MKKYFEVLPEHDLKSMQTFSRNPKYYEALKKLALKNKTINGYEAGKYVIQNISELEIGLTNYKGIYYDLENPRENEKYLKNKLIVVFMPADGIFSPIAKNRIFGQTSWDSLSNSVAKNTYILRLADSNLISGSYYQNTVNFQDFEEKIQDLIKKIANENHISRENIICYGNSRGGVGALYHGALGNYKVVSVDPVICRKAWTEGIDKDKQLIFNLIDYDMSDKINRLLEKTTLSANELKILSSDSAFITYPYIKQLNMSKVTLINIQLSNPRTSDFFATHAQIIGKSVPLQLSLINDFLYEKDIVVENGVIKFDPKEWDMLLPWSNPYFDLHYRDEGLKIVRNDKEVSDGQNWLNSMISVKLEDKKKYTIEIDTMEEIQENIRQSLYFHDMDMFERLNLPIENPETNRTHFTGTIDYFCKFERNVAKKFYYLGINANFWKLGDTLTIKDIKINEKFDV